MSVYSQIQLINGKLDYNPELQDYLKAKNLLD